MRVDSERSAQIASTFRSRLPASINPSPKPLRVGTCLTLFGSSSGARCMEPAPLRTFALRIGKDPFAFGRQLRKRRIGLLLVRRLAVPGVIAFHIRDAFAGNGVRDDH